MLERLPGLLKEYNYWCEQTSEYARSDSGGTLFDTAIAIVPTFEAASAQGWLMHTPKRSFDPMNPDYLRSLRAQAKQRYSSVAKQVEYLQANAPCLIRRPILMPANVLAALPLLAGQATWTALMQYETSTKSFINFHQTVLASMHLHNTTMLQYSCSEEWLDMDFALKQEPRTSQLLHAGDGTIASAAKQYALAMGVSPQDVMRKQAPKLPRHLTSATKAPKLAQVTYLSSSKADEENTFSSRRKPISLRRKDLGSCSGTRISLTHTWRSTYRTGFALVLSRVSLWGWLRCSETLCYEADGHIARSAG